MNQSFTGSYEPGQPTNGPLDDASTLGVPRITPKALKEHLDQFIVGQDRAKMIISSAVFNHYQRILELRRLEDEQYQLVKQRLRAQKRDARPFEGRYTWEPCANSVKLTNVEDESPTLENAIHSPTRTVKPQAFNEPAPTLEKSNILLLGPSGVGKTLIVKTLASLLSIPFSMSDCTPFTQAGYIGEDADVCVERLLAAADYDVAAAEHGIVCLDEIDKLAAAKPVQGRDVSGEGVQQALLKIVEGTTLHIPVKPEKAAGGASKASLNIKDASTSNGSPLNGSNFSSTTSSSSSAGSGSGSSSPSKGETYSVRTDNILFICTGAFIGLHKNILNRVARGSIGFGTALRTTAASASRSTSGPSSPNSATDMMIHAPPGSAEADLIATELPFLVPPSHPDIPPPTTFNALDLVQPTDLQSYGLIPELVGRLPVTVALAPLDESALVRVLAEPRNSIVRQYERQFQMLGVELRFTRGALRAIARACMGMGTGARGLRTCVERLLEDASYNVPGSSVKYVLITEAVAQRKALPEYFIRGQQLRFQAMLADEEEEYEARMRKEGEGTEGGGSAEAGDARGGVGPETHEKRRAAGIM